MQASASPRIFHTHREPRDDWVMYVVLTLFGIVFLSMGLAVYAAYHMGNDKEDEEDDVTRNSNIPVDPCPWTLSSSNQQLNALSSRNLRYLRSRAVRNSDV
jgi:heme/copper-type cytochrome/quinol oxidase subunit 2